MSRAVIETIEEERESQMGTPTDTVIDVTSTPDNATEGAKEDPHPAGDETAEGAGDVELGPENMASIPGVVVVSASTENVEQAKLDVTSLDSSKLVVSQSGQGMGDQASLEGRKSSLRASKAQLGRESIHGRSSLDSSKQDQASLLDRRKSSSIASKAQLGRESIHGRAGGQRSSMMTHERDRLFSARAKSILAGSVLSVRRPSFEPERMKVTRYMNTYRLESQKPFKSEAVTAIIKEVMSKELDDVRYDAATAPKMAISIAAEIRTRVKLQQYDRYKIVCLVDIGEKQAQSIYSAFRCLWDTERDMYAMYNYDNVTLYAVGTCYGIYRD